MNKEQRIRELERRVAELERNSIATAYDILTQYIKRRLEAIGEPVKDYSTHSRSRNYSAGFMFDRNCKFALKSAFSISSVKDLTHDMLDDAIEIVDKLIEVYVRYK
jgi:hypothetical protein|nr:MAG TPA: hypothetical protein [Caudoviricetes sp.]